MNLKELKELYRLRLGELYDEREADRLFFIFLDEMLNISVAGYLSGQLEESGEEDSEKLLGPLRELESGKPYQHILGFTYFLDLRLKVSSAALVPRPETEELAQLIRSQIAPTKPLRILDIGTGTGCLALSCAKKFGRAEVLAIDISESALALARENARYNKLGVQFLELDILQSGNQPKGPWDLIISNPPYIAEWEGETMDDLVVRNEPHQALFVPDNDPLVFYRRIAEFAETQLSDNGKIFLEINERLGQETVSIFTAAGFDAKLVNDFSGKDRFVIASAGDSLKP